MLVFPQPEKKKTSGLILRSHILTWVFLRLEFQFDYETEEMFDSWWTWAPSERPTPHKVTQMKGFYGSCTLTRVRRRFYHPLLWVCVFQISWVLIQFFKRANWWSTVDHHHDALPTEQLHPTNRRVTSASWYFKHHGHLQKQRMWSIDFLKSNEWELRVEERAWW